MPGAVRGGTLHIALVNAPRNPQSPDSPVGSSDFEFLVPFPKSPISTYSKMALLGLGLLSSACFSDPRWICWANRNLAPGAWGHGTVRGHRARHSMGHQGQCAHLAMKSP